MNHLKGIIIFILLTVPLVQMDGLEKTCNIIKIGNKEIEDLLKSALDELADKAGSFGVSPTIKRKSTASNYYVRGRCEAEATECKSCIKMLTNMALDTCHTIGGHLKMKNCGIRWEPYEFTEVELID